MPQLARGADGNTNDSAWAHTPLGTVTTREWEKAFAEAAKLPPEEQDALAQRIRAELESEHRWDEAFASSLDTLSKLVDGALAEHRAGRTEPLDPIHL
jgi:hypothetical protein